MGSPLHGDIARGSQHEPRPDDRRSADLALVFRVQQRLCALPLGHVTETLRPLPVQPMAGVPPYVLGASVIRGEPMPVIDAGRLLQDLPGGAGAPSSGHRPPGRYVTVRCGARQVALAVTEVVGVQPLPPSPQPLPALLQDSTADVVASLGLRDAELLLVLRSTRLLPDDAQPQAAA